MTKEERKEYIKAYRERNKEKIKQQCKLYQENNRTELAAKSKIYIKANREHISKVTKEYYLSHKEEIAIKAQQAKRTILGVIKTIYNNQINNSKKRGHKLPAYSYFEFKEWMFSQSIFIKLYRDWRDSGYIRDLAPSCDRLNNHKGYTFDNIEVVTWGVNRKRAARDMRTGEIIHGNNPQKPVSQFTLDGEFIKNHCSQSQAGREVGISQTAIYQCLTGKSKKSGGFKWKYATTN